MKHRFTITLPRIMVKFLLRFNPFHRHLLIMCLGYGDDFELYTELVYEDDKYLDVFDRVSYEKFSLWICY